MMAKDEVLEGMSDIHRDGTGAGRSRTHPPWATHWLGRFTVVERKGPGSNLEEVRLDATNEFDRIPTAT